MIFMINMLNYIGSNINSSTETIKYAALNVFRSIILTIHKKQFYPVVKQSLHLVSDILLNNNSPHHFKILCVYIIKAITKNFSEELINEEYFLIK